MLNRSALFTKREPLKGFRRRGRTLAKHGITFMENEEDTGNLELFLGMWDSSPSDDRLP